MKQFDVVVRYQEFRKNGLASFDGSDLVYEPNSAVEIGEFGVQGESEKEACENMFYILNHVDPMFYGRFPGTRAAFRVVGHTSMSVGDIVEFMVSGNVYIVAPLGFKLVATRLIPVL